MFGRETRMLLRRLDAIALWLQQQTAKAAGYEYCDLGWVLETNHSVIRMAERFGAVSSQAVRDLRQTPLSYVVI